MDDLTLDQWISIGVGIASVLVAGGTFLLAWKTRYGPVFATVELRDGRIVDGYVHAYTVADVEADRREFSFQRPIFARPSAKKGSRTLLDVDYLVLSGGDILYLSLRRSRSRFRSAPPSGL